MNLYTSLLLALGIATASAYALTPVAIRLAARWRFYDMPAGYKKHGRPTPYLGGLAVTFAFVLGALVTLEEPDRTLPIVGGVLVLCAVGTVDDRWQVSPSMRVAVEAALAVGLWALGLGWSLGLGSVVDLLLTIVWIVGVVNAFNLFDNMDGAAGTMGAVVTGAVAVLGIATDNPWLGTTAVALCGACLGFLPHNIASPARIFLGDGGSMPIGFAVAALVMVGTSDAAPAWQALATAVMLVGIPALDTALVMVSRRRRGIPILTGGRDHLTHRTRRWLSNARAVAIALGSVQAVFAVLAVAAVEGGTRVLVPAVTLYLLAAGVAIVVLDARYDREAGDPATRLPAPSAAPPLLRGRPPAATLLGLLVGLSPFLHGFYDSRYWAPAGVVTLVLLIGAFVAAPVRLGKPAQLTLAGLAALSAWALLSAQWAESNEDAIVTGNRLVVLATMLGLLLVLVHDRRRAAWALAGAVAGTAVVAGYVVCSMLFGDAAELFIAGRLHEPLEYINGLGATFVIAAVPVIALASRRGSVVATALGLALASAFASLALLSQSRGVAIAAAAALVVFVVLGPGRLRRCLMATLMLAVLAVVSRPLLDVYQAAAAGALDDDVVAGAGRAVLIALGLGAAVGAALGLVERRLSPGGIAAGRKAYATALAIGVVAAAGLVVASWGSVSDQVRTQYDAFVHVGDESTQLSTTTRLVSGAGNRYDYWRIAVDTWRDAPWVGVGAGGYAVPYFAERRTLEDVRQPHSLELQVLAELGLVGLLLLAAMLGGAFWGIARAVRRGASPLTVGGAAMFAFWLVHTSGDWLHLLPGVTGLAFVGLAAVLGPQGEPLADATRRGWRRSLAPTVAAFVGIAAVVGALVLLGRQTLVEHYTRESQAALASDPEEALRLADQATELDPDSIQPYYLRAASLARFGDGDGAVGTLRRALKHEPSNFVTWALLGDLQVRMGRPAAAAEAYGRAAQLNPRDEELAASAREQRRAAAAPAG